nr:PREDICTED: perilipin-1 [Anolis carolinensis]|eukprot:XP_008116737.1 PREDICTED: perilipin-1 [Anolis carolinensis]
MGLATESYEWPKNSVKAPMVYARSSRVSHIVEAGGKGITGKREKLVDVFPKEENPSAYVPPRTSVSKEISPTTAFRKVTTLATSISQHVYKQTVQAIQLVKAKGEELAVWIPALTSKRADLQGMLGRLAHNLHTAYLSSILLVKNAPFIAWSTAGQLLHVSTHKAVSEAGAKAGILQGIASKLLGTIIHYIPLPEVLESEEEAATGDQTESILEDEDVRLIIARQLQDRRRSSRGHYPIPFLNLDDPLPPQQAPSQRQRGPVSEAEHFGSRKSAGTRRWSEGLFRPPPEAIFTRAHSIALKKD